MPIEKPCSIAEISAQSMLDEGLLTPDDAGGESIATVTLGRVANSLLDEPVEEWPPVHPRHIWAFGKAFALATIELKVLPFESVTTRFAARRGKLGSSVDLASRPRRLHELVVVFSRLRPYFFASHDTCMLSSLTLSRFLHQFGIPCTWVFGVQDAPFSAHCWLVHGTTVLNDSVERVSEYTPLLEV